MYLLYNRFSLTTVYCINLLKPQKSFISIYIEYLLKKIIGFDNHYNIIKFVGFELIYYVINLSVVSS